MLFSLYLFEMYQVAVGVSEIEPLHARSRAMQVISDFADFHILASDLPVSCLMSEVANHSVIPPGFTFS